MSSSLTVRRGRRPDPALRDQWQQRLARFDTSGLTAPAFCAQEGLSLPSFYSWRRRLNAPPSQPSATQPSRPASFVPVQLLTSPPVELQLPCGVTLRLPPGCDLAFVRSLVFALGEQPC